MSLEQLRQQVPEEDVQAHKCSPVGMVWSHDQIKLWHAAQESFSFLRSNTPCQHYFQAPHVAPLPLCLHHALQEMLKGQAPHHIISKNLSDDDLHSEEAQKRVQDFLFRSMVSGYLLP